MLCHGCHVKKFILDLCLCALPIQGDTSHAERHRSKTSRLERTPTLHEMRAGSVRISNRSHHSLVGIPCELSPGGGLPTDERPKLPTPPRSPGIVIEEGKAPELPPDVISCVEASFDCEADNPDEISFKEGDKIYVTNRCDDDWWVGYVSTTPSLIGVFPCCFVTVLQ